MIRDCSIVAIVRCSDKAKKEELSDGNGKEVDFCGIVGFRSAASIVDCGLFPHFRGMWLRRW
jgi:hypothetical protein